MYKPMNYKDQLPTGKKKKVNALSKKTLVWRNLPLPLAGLVLQSTYSLHRSTVPIQLLSD